MSRISLSSFVFGLFLVASVVNGANIQVEVGKTGLTFEPDSIKAVAGDTITYNFHPKNHSVTQSSFLEPCKPLEGGFFSGFVKTEDANAASRTSFTITVQNDDDPIWVYCGQTTGNHCQMGMVHAINAPPQGNTIDAFRARAKSPDATTPSISPPGGVPLEGKHKGVRKTSVDVGVGTDLMFNSNNITEPPGTVIEFSFNPKNHSVVQSSFKDPCHPQAGGGFSSGFIPTTVSPSGATFKITVPDTKPIWFYCAQTTKTHCQAGMVGSINAPTVGDNTLQAFIDSAKTAGTSTIPPDAPIGGTLTVNGTIVTSLNGNVLDPTDVTGAAPPVTSAPPPGATIPPDVGNMAGGYPPSKYGWANTITDDAVKLLQLINFVENILVDVLVNGYNNITQGGWSHIYPTTIKNTVGSMSAQAIVHRSTSTDSLKHYNKPIMDTCTYSYPISNVADFMQVVLRLILLEIALLLDVISVVVTTDTWMIGPLASALGSKARMAGLVNMMQNHIPAAAPREVMIPAELVYSYVSNHYVKSGTCKDAPTYNVVPPLTITPAPMEAGRVKSVTVNYDAAQKGGLYMAWLGAWGGIEYTNVVPDASTPGKGTATVPDDLSGHVWGVLSNATDKAVGDLPNYSVGGPEILWVTQPN